MLNLILQKKSIRLSVTMITFLMFFAVTLALAVVVSEKINAKKGGTINIDEGVELVIPPGALDKNTEITVRMERDDKKMVFEFWPGGLVFNKPVELKATYEALSGIKDLNLYLVSDPNSITKNYIEKIRPVKYDWGVVWYLDHFSIYYYRLR